MSSKKLYYLLAGLLVLLAGSIIGVAYGSDMLFKQASDTLMQQKVMSLTLDSKQKQLSKDKKDVEKYTELNNISKAIVPKDKDTAQAVREIVNLARESNIPRLTSVTFPASTLGSKPVPAAGASSSATNNSLTQLAPVSGISSVYNLQITVQLADTAAVPYNTFITFLEKLEQNRRTAQVSNITVTPNSKNPNLVAFTLVIDEYIKP